MPLCQGPLIRQSKDCLVHDEDFVCAVRKDALLSSCGGRTVNNYSWRIEMMTKFAGMVGCVAALCLACAPANASTLLYSGAADVGKTDIGSFSVPSTVGITGTLFDLSQLPSTLYLELFNGSYSGPLSYKSVSVTSTGVTSPGTASLSFNLAAGTYYGVLVDSSSNANAVVGLQSGPTVPGGIFGAPLPGALVLFGTALAGAGAFMRRRGGISQQVA
jgi:hypothetical protein